MDLAFFRNETLMSMVEDLKSLVGSQILNEFQSHEIQELIDQIDLEFDRRHSQRVMESR